MKKFLSLLLSAMLIVAGLTSCGTDSTSGAEASSNTAGSKENSTEETKNMLTGKHHVEITVKDKGVIAVELDADTAPITVTNFVELANSGFYDGLTFHRIIEGFMIQGGDPAGTGAGGPDYCIKGEFSQNGFETNLAHTPGVLSMARTMFPDSAGSQFFIMHKAAPHLDGAYAAFGKVTEGLEVVDKIASVNTDYSDKPLQPQRMATVTVETFGVEYPEPEKC